MYQSGKSPPLAKRNGMNQSCQSKKKGSVIWGIKMIMIINKI